jgi:hypothetical protein
MTSVPLENVNLIHQTSEYQAMDQAQRLKKS